MSTKLLILALTVNSVIGQLMLKRALAALGGAAALGDMPRFIRSAAVSPWIYSSVAIQGFGYFLWMMLISRVKLGVAAASVGATFYVLMAAAAWLLYGETLSALQWLGIVLVTVGVLCINLGPG
jgi:drug/metabolite transporter (DMT)-like permease